MHLIDVFLTFNTAFYKEGIVIEDRNKIAENYLRFQFWIDIATILAMSLSAMQLGGEYLNIVYLLRFYQIKEITNDIDERYRIQ
jgi:hypothetical protein